MKTTRDLVLAGLALAALGLGLTACASAERATADPLRNGATRATSVAPGFEVYDARRALWIEPDVFLDAYYSNRGAATYPPSATYPPYARTKEADTIRRLTPDGACEMTFWHTRWRRTTDTEGWGQALRVYKACATVFDHAATFAPAAP